MTQTIEPDISVMDLLKSATTDMHAATEQHTFHKTLSSGKLPIETFIDYLKQLFVIHEHLETWLIQHRTCPAIEGVVLGHEYKLPYLVADLRHFGSAVRDFKPTPNCAKLIEHMRSSVQTDPVHLLGYLYVLEGSTNGAKFTAKALRQAYQLPPNAGLAYFDPYGNAQRPIWQAFKTRMNELELNAAERDGIVRSALCMFEAIRLIGDDLLEHGRCQVG